MLFRYASVDYTQKMYLGQY